MLTIEYVLIAIIDYWLRWFPHARAVFEINTSLEKCDEEIPEHLDSDSVEEIKRELKFAIQGENDEKIIACYLSGIFGNRVISSFNIT